MMRFNDLTFDAAMLTAQRDDAAELRFTRKERALLVQFAARPGQLLSRTHLVDVLATDGAETTERNVDFVVNRLRAKLGDNAREPRFIATQYGEGYVWIARLEGEVPRDAFLVIGPVYGLDVQDAESSLLAHLTAALEQAIGADARIACVPGWRPNTNTPPGVNYTLEASFHRDAVALHAAFVLRHAPTRQVIQTFRATFAAEPDLTAIGNLAARLRQAIWAHIAMPVPQVIAPSDSPLEVRMHDAAIMLARTPEAWRESEALIDAARAATPDDPALAIMRGLALYARLIQRVGSSDGTPSDEWRQVEDEIETLALGCLPAVQDNPLLVLGAAKLLFFIDRGHLALAEQLAEDAFAHSTAFAAAFATLGQLRMCRGRISEAVTLYDKGIEMSEAGSEFQIYLLILKCTALLAADDRSALEKTATTLYAAKPMTRMQVGLMLASPDEHPLPPDLEMMLRAIDEVQAGRFLAYLYHVSARHFEEAAHRTNVMKGLRSQFTRRFGKDVMPGNIVQAMATFGSRIRY